MLPSKERNAGFTLIELVVVLAILAALAGLVIPQISMLGRTTDMATSAKTQADIASNLQLYFLLQKRYPQRLDSLLVGSAGSTPTGVYVPVIDAGSGQQTSGLPQANQNLHTDLSLATLTANQRRSFQKSGFDFLMDHDTSEINANNSGKFERVVPTSGTMPAAVVTPGSAAAIKMLPNTLGIPETGSQLVAVGVGPRNSSIPTAMMNAPIYPGCDGRYYGRYIAVYQVYESQERAVLIMVLDSYGRAPDYTIQQYNESLPNGGRQG